MAVYSPMNVAKYDIQFDKILKSVKGKMAAVLKKTAEGCMNDIIDHPSEPYRRYKRYSI